MTRPPEPLNLRGLRVAIARASRDYGRDQSEANKALVREARQTYAYARADWQLSVTLAGVDLSASQRGGLVGHVVGTA